MMRIFFEGFYNYENETTVERGGLPQTGRMAVIFNGYYSSSTGIPPGIVGNF